MQQGRDRMFIAKSKVKHVIGKHVRLMETVKGNNAASLNTAIDALQEILDLM